MPEIDASVWDPPLVRQALDRLLVLYPMFDLVSIDWQMGGNYRTGFRHRGVWVLVALGQPSEGFDELPAWALWHFAIFKATGALHNMEHGEVIDPPIWTPTMNDAP